MYLLDEQYYFYSFCNNTVCLYIIIIIIKDIYVAPFCHAPKALCKKKVKC